MLQYIKKTPRDKMKQIHTLSILLFVITLILPATCSAKTLQDKTNPIQSLTLTTPQTHFVRIKLAGEYMVVEVKKVKKSRGQVIMITLLKTFNFVKVKGSGDNDNFT